MLCPPPLDFKIETPSVLVNYIDVGIHVMIIKDTGMKTNKISTNVMEKMLYCFDLILRH